MDKYFITLGKLFYDQRKVLIEELKKEYPAKYFKEFENLQWLGEVFSSENTAFYPDNCLVYNFCRNLNREVLELMKAKLYDVESYPSSIDLIEDKCSILPLIESSSIIDTPRLVYKSPPLSKYYIDYNSSKIALRKTLPDTKYTDLYGELPSLEEGFLPVIVVSTLFGEVIDKALLILEENKAILYYNDETSIQEYSETSLSTVSSFISPQYISKEIKEKIERGQKILDKILDDVEMLTFELSQYLLIGRAEYYITVIDDIPILLNIEAGDISKHSLVYQIMDTKSYFKKEKEIVQMILDLKGGIFSG